MEFSAADALTMARRLLVALLFFVAALLFLLCQLAPSTTEEEEPSSSSSSSSATSSSASGDSQIPEAPITTTVPPQPSPPSPSPPPPPMPSEGLISRRLKAPRSTLMRGRMSPPLGEERVRRKDPGPVEKTVRWAGPVADASPVAHSGDAESVASTTEIVPPKEHHSVPEPVSPADSATPAPTPATPREHRTIAAVHEVAPKKPRTKRPSALGSAASGILKAAKSKRATAIHAPRLADETGGLVAEGVVPLTHPGAASRPQYHGVFEEDVVMTDAPEVARVVEDTDVVMTDAPEMAPVVEDVVMTDAVSETVRVVEGDHVAMTDAFDEDIVMTDAPPLTADDRRPDRNEDGDITMAEAEPSAAMAPAWPVMPDVQMADVPAPQPPAPRAADVPKPVIAVPSAVTASPSFGSGGVSGPAPSSSMAASSSQGVRPTSGLQGSRTKSSGNSTTAATTTTTTTKTARRDPALQPSDSYHPLRELPVDVAFELATRWFGASASELKTLCKRLQAQGRRSYYQDAANLRTLETIACRFSQIATFFAQGAAQADLKEKAKEEWFGTPAIQDSFKRGLDCLAVTSFMCQEGGQSPPDKARETIEAVMALIGMVDMTGSSRVGPAAQGAWLWQA